MSRDEMRINLNQNIEKYSISTNKDNRQIGVRKDGDINS